MNLPLFPRSSPGRWSVWISLGALAAYLLLYLLGTRLNLLPPLVVMFTLNMGLLGSFACGILATIAVFRRDMAVLLLLPVIVSLGTLCFIFGVLARGAG